MSEKQEHRSQLDGLRGLAALAVCCYACFSLTGTAEPSRLIIGLFGAQLFFTLSGFLISRNLLLNASGQFFLDLKSFYARRFLRIAPIYYLVLVGIQLRATIPRPVPYYTFVANSFSGQQQTLLTNLSTISTEMQFYALAPILLIATPAKYRVALLALVLFVLNVGQFIFQILFQESAPLTILECGQYLLWGCIAGYLQLHWNKLKEIDGTFLFLVGIALNSVWLWMALCDQFSPIHWNSILTLTRGLGSSLLILGLWQARNKILALVFENPASVYLGRVSYGFFLCLTLSLVYTQGLPLEYRIALSLVLGLTLSTLSYRYLEFPLILIKRQAFPVPTDEAHNHSLDLSLKKTDLAEDKKVESVQKNVPDKSIAGLVESSAYDWLKVAKNAYEAGSLEGARTYYHRAMELFRDDEPTVEIQIDCLRHLIEICRTLKRDNEALVIARRCATISMRAGNAQYTTSLLDLALCLHASGCHDQAKAVLLDALRVSEVDQGRPLTPGASRVFNELFPPVSDGEILIEVEKTLKRGTREREERFRETMAILVATILCFVSFGVQSQGMPFIEMSNLSPAGEYKTIDGLKSIRFFQGATASVWDHGKVYAANYETLGMIPFDFMKAIPGLNRKNVSFLTIGQDLAVGSDGSVMYTSDAPELRLYQAMLKMSYFVNWYYSKYQHYPENSSDWLKERDIWYENPFTQAKQYAAYTDFDPKGEPNRSEAGMIRCKTIGTDGFLISGYGRNGQRLVGSEGNQVFYFELKRGKNLTEDYIHRFEGDFTNPRQTSEQLHFYLAGSNQVKNILSALRALPQLVFPFWFASLATALILLRLFRREEGRLFVLSAMIIPTLLVFLVVIMSIGD